MGKPLNCEQNKTTLLFCDNEKLHGRGQAFAKRSFVRRPSATGLCPVAGLEFFRACQV